MIVFILHDTEMALYKRLKEISIKKFRIRSQAFLESSLRKESSVVSSIAGNIGLQIAAKYGIPLWEVKRQSEYWKDKSVATMGLSFSRCPSDGTFTLGMVGMTSNSQTSVHTFCKSGMNNREAIPKNILDNFNLTWLQKYYKTEQRLPDTIVVYREGLSEAQLRKTVCPEVISLEDAVKKIRTKSAEFTDYSPEIVFLTVNRKINSRFYMNNPKKNVQKNPTPGSVVYCEMSNQEAIDFLLIPQKVDKGCATPCQYRLAFYKA